MSARMCEHCDCVRINGIKCHEHGCPVAWKDEIRECRACEDTFAPISRDQVYCEDCAGITRYHEACHGGIDYYTRERGA